MGKIYAVGLGPGEAIYRTAQADAALAAADILCGYTVYIDLIRDAYPEKKVIATSMRQERERCILALEAAQGGGTVAMVCSGDAGVYGMAGLLYEMLADYPGVELEVVPGITAALSGAALLGSPLTNDFAVISLSNLLTPWETIEKRLHGAAAADFVICLYNPSSKRRADHLERACDVLLAHRSPQTPCGIARNIGREGETCQVMPLHELRETQVDMFSTVFIGNGDTCILDGRLVTRRGYRDAK